jgi:hypothetical protein
MGSSGTLTLAVFVLEVFAATVFVVGVSVVIFPGLTDFLDDSGFSVFSMSHLLKWDTFLTHEHRWGLSDHPNLSRPPNVYSRKMSFVNFSFRLTNGATVRKKVTGPVEVIRI